MTAEDWIFEPRDFVRYLGSSVPRHRDPLRLPSRIVMVFGRNSHEALCRAFRARPIDWNPRIAVGRAGRRAVAVVRSGIGAPASAIELEESIALGARSVLFFGACGSLRPTLFIGDAVLPTAAFSDEGTSRHYGGGRWSRPDPSLVDVLRVALRRRSMPVREGAIWTTDAAYRERRATSVALKRRGVVGVEMEASALFAVGRARGVRVAGLLVVSDELAGKSWKPGFDSPAYRKGIRGGVKAIADAMSGGLR